MKGIFEFKKQYAISGLGFIILLFWYFTYQVSCIFLIVPAFIGAVIFKTNFEILKAKKLCVANCYFKESSFFYKLLTKKIVIFIFALISGVFLSSILVLNVITFNLVDFILLSLDLVLILYLYNKFSNNNTFKENVKEPIIKNSVSIFNSIVLMFIFSVANIYQTPPEYIQSDLIQTVKAASNNVYSNCEITDNISRLSNEIIAVKWWGMLNLTVNNNSYYIKELIWLIYLLGSYLMIFAYTRYILELISFAKEKFDGKK